MPRGDWHSHPPATVIFTLIAVGVLLFVVRVVPVVSRPVRLDASFV